MISNRISGFHTICRSDIETNTKTNNVLGNDYITVNEAAELLGMSREGVHYRIKTGKIRVKKVGFFLLSQNQI